MLRSSSRSLNLFSTLRPSGSKVLLFKDCMSLYFVTENSVRLVPYKVHYSVDEYFFLSKRMRRNSNRSRGTNITQHGKGKVPTRPCPHSIFTPPASSRPRHKFRLLLIAITFLSSARR